MKYKLKENIIRIVLLCGIWLIENIQNIESYGKADTGAKYNQFILDYICNPYGDIYFLSAFDIKKKQRGSNFAKRQGQIHKKRNEHGCGRGDYILC